MIYKHKRVFLKRKVVCVDFDGVIYQNMNYKGTTTLNELPVVGAIDSLHELSKSYEVVINSARCETDEGMKAVQKWLTKHGISYRLSKYKPRADVYIDDRAVCFNGDWETTLKEVNEFKQWQSDDKFVNKLTRKEALCHRSF